MPEVIHTALVLRRDHLAWTVLRERKGALEIVDQCAAAIEPPAGGPDEADDGWAARIKARCAGIKGHLTISMPTEQVLLRVLRLPSADPAEVSSMIDLQVDKFAPFPIDQMVVGIEQLEVAAESTRVLVACVPSEAVEKVGSVCMRAGLQPLSVDVDILGWWRLLCDAGSIAKEGRQLVLVLDESGSELILVQDGSPLVFRSLGTLRPSDPAGSAQDLAEELEYTLTMFEAEWGAREIGPMQIWHAPAYNSGFLDAVQAATGRPSTAHTLANLPPLAEGLARRAIQRQDGMVDLAPHAWKQAGAQRAARRSLFVAGGVLLAVWFSIALVFFVLLQIRLSGLKAVRTEAAQLAGPTAAVKELQSQIRSLERYSDRTYSAIECLREICVLLPAGVDLTSLTYKKYGSVNLRGECPTSDPIYDFTSKLQASTLFREVKPEGVTDETRGGRQRSQFRMTLALPPEEEP